MSQALRERKTELPGSFYFTKSFSASRARGQSRAAFGSPNRHKPTSTSRSNSKAFWSLSRLKSWTTSSSPAALA
jgi:hypothetical protein